MYMNPKKIEEIRHNTGLNPPVAHQNIMFVPCGLTPEGEQDYLEMQKWVYKDTSNTSYNQRQPRRYQDRSKY